MTHPTHAMHENSLLTYKESRPQRLTLQAQIVAMLKRHGPMTDEEIAQKMAFSHSAMVRPRITELVKKGTLREFAEKRKNGAGYQVRVVGIVE